MMNMYDKKMCMNMYDKKMCMNMYDKKMSLSQDSRMLLEIYEYLNIKLLK